jgi:hypothetical protein
MSERMYTIDDKKRACIILAVLHYITVLTSLDEVSYWETYADWTEHRWEDPAWSEGFSHRIPVVTGPAFQSACQKVAALAFCPGGVRIFSTWFMAKRQPDWCAWSIWNALGQHAWSVVHELYTQAGKAVEEAAKPKTRRSSKKKG